MMEIFMVVFIPRKVDKRETSFISHQVDNEFSTNVELLQKELAEARTNLLALKQQIALQKEQLQSSNEELLATNEELQSTNEEQQSTNEELHSVNSELGQKLQELAVANSTIDSILKSTEITTLVLTKDFKLKSITPNIREVFNINPSDLGRSLSDFTHHLTNDTIDELLGNCKKVLKSGKPRQKEVTHQNNKHYLKRITPFINHENEVEGLVVTFVDITAQKEIEYQLRDREAQLETLFTNSPDMVWAHDINGIIIKCSNEMAEKLGYGTTDFYVGTHMKDYIPKQYHAIVDKHFSAIKNGLALDNRRGHFKTKEGKEIPYIGNIRPILNDEGEVDYVIASCKDMTALEAAENELEKSRQNYKAVFDHAPEIFLVVDREGKITNCNQRSINKFGFETRDDLMGKYLGQFVHKDFQEQFKKHFSDLVEGIPCKEVKSTFVSGSGDSFPVLADAEAVLKESGEVNYIIVSLKDITEIDKSQQLLKTQMQAFEEATDGFYDWKIAENTIYTSKSIKDWFGYEEHEMPNTFDSWRKLMLKEDLQKMDASLEKHFKSRGSVPHSVVEKYHHKDGSLVHLQARGKVIEWDENNNPIRMVGSHTNITKLLELPILEQKIVDQNMAFEKALESNMIGFWDWNIKNNTEYLSPTFKKMFGYEDHEMENSPDSWQKIIHTDDLPIVNEVFESHVRSKGEVPYDNEVRIFHKNGQIVWVWRKGKVIDWDDKGNPIRMVGSHVDITHLKELTDSNKQLERFAYVASHDLQEPLRTVNDFVKLFKDEYGETLEKEGHIYLDFIKSAAIRMQNLVIGILEYSKIKGEINREMVELDKVVEDVLLDLQIKIDDLKADIKVANLPVINGNAIELHSLFLNLIGNALKFVDGKAPKILIQASKASDKFQFLVQDNGIGIKEEHQEKIFDIFTRLHQDESYVGTGIGLAHCKKIVELHGGKIWVDSEPGQGSKFYFTLKA